MIKNFLKNKKDSLLAALIIVGLAVGYAWADWATTSDSPHDNNSTAPINVGVTDQVKSGGLALWGNLGARHIIATQALGIGEASMADMDPLSVLDITGQIRIRGNAGDPPINDGDVLTSDANGRASWAPPSVNTSYNINNGFGIAPITPITPIIEINPAETQRRILGTCADPQAVQSVEEDGTVVNCRSFVTSVATTSMSAIDLTHDSVTGQVTLDRIRVGGGGLYYQPFLQVRGRTVFWINYSGLAIENNSLKLRNTCPDKYYWFSLGGGYWDCAAGPDPSSIPTSPPGSGVMYLKAKVGFTPAVCPAGWTDLGTHQEAAGSTSNVVRTCVKSDQSCQVTYFKSATSPPPGCGSSAGGSPPPGTLQAATWAETYVDGVTHFVRACYLCH